MPLPLYGKNIENVM